MQSRGRYRWDSEKKVRDYMVDGKLMQRVVHDLQYLMDVKLDEEISIDTINLRDDKEKLAKYGVNYEERE